MPTILRSGPYRFFFYSNEGNEPPHVHVESGDMLGKVWLTPIEVADQDGYSDKEMRKIVEIVAANRAKMEKTWHDYFD
ncbi:MAG: DUF4160 domain-containing protein [Ktedonobacterales bacterium]